MLIGVDRLVLRTVIFKDAGDIFPHGDRRHVADKDHTAQASLDDVFAEMREREMSGDVFGYKHRQREEYPHHAKQRGPNRKHHLPGRNLFLFSEADIRGEGERAHADPHHLNHRGKTADDGPFPKTALQPIRTEP